MLQTLTIKNVALITTLTIDFSSGFNVLMGETGAGKSIIFDALNFVLGSKADKTLIRYGETEMRVDAVFTNLSQQCTESLSELGYEDEEVCLSRSLNLDGKSLVRINGLAASQSVLREVGKLLVDSYSQHESVELLKSKNHLAMLDKFGGDKIASAKEQVKQLCQQYNEILKKIAQLGGDEYERERTQSLLQYQVEEIENAELKPGEDEEVAQRLKFLGSAEKIYQSVSICEEFLNDGANACIRQLQQASSQLGGLLSFPEIEECKKRLDSARYELEDVADSLNEIKSSTEFDEREFDKLDRRNDLIRSLCKKYGGSVENVLGFLSDAKTKLNELSDSEFLLSKYEKEKETSYSKLSKACDELTEIRKNTAKSIEDRILQQLQQLGMKSSRFEVKFDKTNPSSNGQDAVEFVFSANKGQEVKSLAKTASGGELSRFMLAVKNIFSEIGGAQTLVFDEIDSGISGETGNIVGEKINNISKYAQILCITHLPQVAAYADNMYLVSKEEDDNTTKTKIKLVEKEEMIDYIAKLTVGDSLTDAARKQAEEMRRKTGK